MSFRLPAVLKSWHADELLKKVIRNTGYLFSSNTLAMGLSFVQSIFAARLLGVAAFGLLEIIIKFSTTINRLFSFRMGELVVRYVGKAHAEKQNECARAVILVAGITEGLTSVLAFGVLYAAAPLAAEILAKDASLVGLFRFYGLSILFNMVEESSIGLLQVFNRFKGQAVVNAVQSCLTAGIIVAAFLLKANLPAILMAYLIGKIVLSMGYLILALIEVNKEFGGSWWRVNFSALPPIRELAHFALSTNLSASIKLLVRDSEHLWVAFFLNPTAVGYSKTALALINLVMMPISPILNTTFPEIIRGVARRAWDEVTSLLRHSTIIAAVWTVGTSLFLLFFGKWVILFYGEQYLPAYPALMVMLAGFGIANIFFWNRTLFLAFGKPMLPFYVMLVGAVIKIILGFIFVPRLGYVFEAFLLSANFILTVGYLVWRGLRELRIAKRMPVVVSEL